MNWSLFRYRTGHVLIALSIVPIVYSWFPSLPHWEAALYLGGIMFITGILLADKEPRKELAS